MKKRTALWNGVSVLIVAVLIIMALFRNNLQPWLYVGVFSMWGIWAAAKFLVPYIREQKELFELKRLQKERERSMQDAQMLTDADTEGPVGLVLLRHVNFRITDFLKSAYPEAAWEWCEKNPERLIANGGNGRIRIFNVHDFNYAEVHFDKQANIDCSMLKMVPITEIDSEPKGDSDEHSAKPPKAVDPQIWYEVNGRKVLETLITDLSSRGYKNLLIKDNGEVCIQQDKNEIKQSVLKNMPEKVYWSGLVKVFEREGLAAKSTDAGVVLSW